MITSRDAFMILDRNGFRVPNGGDSYGEITYNGERSKQVRACFENRNNKMCEIDRQIAILEAEYYRRHKED